MTIYQNFDTGETFTREEIEKLFNDFRHELKEEYQCFDDYLDELLLQGLNKTGGLIKVEQ